MANPLALTSSKLTKVEVIGYGQSDKSAKIGQMKLQVNPNSITHGHSVNLKDNLSSGDNKKQTQQAVGTSGVPTQLSTVENEKINFKFTLDATGTIKGCEDVLEAIREFKMITYQYNGKSHDTPYVELVWDEVFDTSLTSNGSIFRLTSLSIEYKLFKPSGKPLRAELTVAFSEYNELKMLAKEANRNSPDMTHMRLVKLGDNLPAMCKEVYGDARYYLDIAKYNKLNSIFNISPGQKLYFPPLTK